MAVESEYIVRKPIKISSLPKIRALACGEQHVVFLDSEGNVWSCGWNNDGQLGLGNNLTIFLPERITTITQPVTSVACGLLHSLFLDCDGSVWGCGANHQGQIGMLGRTSVNVPEIIQHIPPITSIVCGVSHSFFVEHNGTVWGAGSGAYLGSLPNKLQSLFAASNRKPKRIKNFRLAPPAIDEIPQKSARNT